MTRSDAAPGRDDLPDSVLVALGSNLGDREATLREAVRRVGEQAGVRWVKLSSWWETEPVGGPPQGRYLNGVGELRTRLSPRALLERLQAVELALGRRREVPDGPRTIDLDILAWGDLRLEEQGLIIPHPRLCERAFVLGPLQEVAPDAIHPLTGQTYRHHWEILCRGGGRRCT